MLFEINRCPFLVQEMSEEEKAAKGEELKNKVGFLAFP